MKYIILFLISLLIGESLYGQNPNIITLSSPDSGNKNYVAQTKIQMTPGYKYTAGPNAMRAYIEQATSYGPLYSSASFDGATINTGLPVGSVNGEMTISEYGAMNYFIPIKLPPGTNDLVPNLGISYNSQGGNDILGMGWSLTGLSSISVTPTTWYQDGSVDEVKLDGTDKLALDGKRLHLISGTYGANNAVYYTENESYNKITSYSSAGVQWFNVETKDGMTLEYGKTLDSRVKDQNGDAFILWKLNKISDAYGNYIQFVYRNHNNESRIDKIFYTGNESQNLTPYNTIEFEYQTRTDLNSAYVKGTEFKMNTLLSSIRISTENGELVKTYEFNYGENRYSYLRMIKEIGSDGTKLNPTIFKYGEKGEDVEAVVTSFSTASSAVTSGDYNGDGKMDMLVRNGGSWEVLVSDGAGGFSHYASGGIPVGYEVYFSPKAANQAIPGMSVTFDFFGDGQDDIIFAKYNTTVVDGIQVFNNLELRIQDINGLDDLAPVYSPAINMVGYFMPDKFLNIGDYDGDGRDDILYIRYSSPSNLMAYAELITVTGGVETVVLSDGLQYVNSSYGIYPNDLDGDGKAELFVKGSSKWENFELKKSGSFYTVDKTYSSSGSGYFPHVEIYQGDFNGDGKTDVLTTNSGRTAWSIGYSDGTGYRIKPFTFNKSTTDLNEFTFRMAVKVMDFNGDGKSDIVQLADTDDGTAGIINFYPSKGIGFDYKTKSIDRIITYLDFVYGDFNGDGKVEIFNQEPTAYSNFTYYFNKDGRDQLLTKVKNGYGQVSEVSYAWLSKGTNYTKGTAAAWPIVDIQPAIPVVSSLTNPDGIGGTSVTDYTYEGAKLHRHGKGFLGFMKSTVSNNVSNAKLTREYELQLTPKLILLKKEKTSLISTGALLSEITYTNNVTMTGLRYKVEVSAINENNLLTTVVKTKSMTYDPYGNLLQLTANDGVETVTTSSTYVAFGTWWIPSRLSTITVTKTRSGQTAFSENKNCFYNTFGNMYQEVRFPGTSTALTKTFGFDNFGNMITEIISSPSLNSIVRTAEFDAKGRFMIKHSNPLNQATQIVYDKKWGLPLNTQTPDGLTVQNTYNSFGSVLSNTSQTGIVTTIQKQWSISSGSATPTSPQNTLYFVKTEAQYKPYTITWYDLLEREVQVDNEGQSSVTRIVTNYDSKGNVYTKTNPFVAGGSAVYTTYVYDVYGRVTSKNNGAANTTYSYASTGGQTTVTETSPTGTVTRIIDAANKLVSNSDNSGTLSYTYYSSDKMKQVSMGGTVLNSFEYDQYGNRTKLVDKDAGTNLSVFNAFEQLTSTTNANGEQFQMVYDIMGRETSRTGPDGVKTTTYVTSGNGLNMPLKITHPNGTYIENTYDSYGRPLWVNEVVDGVSYLTSVTYDVTKDRITSMIYPSSYKIRFNYDANGFVSSVKNDAGTVTMFDAPETNMYGEYTKYTLGDGNTVQKTYNAYGNLTSIVVPGVQNLETSFSNSTGNLLYRKDHLKNRIEEFQYDGMQRLTQSKVSIPTNGLVVGLTNMTYSPNGNISSKSDVGSYQYDVDKIHAVSKVDNTDGSIPSLQQDITYTSLGMASTIVEGDNSLSITYGPDNSRLKSVLTTAGTTVKTKYFIGGLYEKEVTPTSTREIHYIPTGDNTNAVYVIEDGIGSYYYLYRDHLGSVVAMTKSSGVVIYEQNFDAWGNRRDPSNWMPTTTLPSAGYAWVRGFTGHEHLDEFGIVNMNNRLYDPILGRMMEADNLIQDPYFTQAYNRYSYVVNNPLRFMDPSGDFWFVPIIAGAIVGATIGGVVAEANGVKWWKGSIIGGIVGAGLGAVGAYAGAAVAPSGIAWSMTVNGLAGANLAMLSNVAQGKSVDKIYTSGLLGLGAGALGTGLTSVVGSAGLAYAISGGLYGGFDRLIDSHMKGYDNETKFKNFTIGFVEGAATGALAAGKFIGPVSGTVSGSLFMQTTLTTIGITSIPGAAISIGSWVTLGLLGSPKIYENYGASSSNDFLNGIPFSGYKALHPVWKYLRVQVFKPFFSGFFSGNLSEIQMFPTSYDWKEEYNYYK